MKNTKQPSHVARKFSGNGAVKRDGAIKRPPRAPVFKHPKTELEAAIQRYVDLFEFAPIAYVSFDRSGRIEEINLSAAELLGSTRARLIGEPFALHVTTNDRGLFLNHLLRCRSSDRRVETELHLKNRDGEILVVHLASSPMTASMRDGALLYQTAIVDRTDRRRTEEQLAEQARLLDLSNDAILIRDAQNRIIYWNHGARELYGYSAQEALGKVTHKLLRTEHPQSLARIRKKLERNGRWSGEIVHRRKDGTKVVVMSRWALDRDVRGNPLSILETNTDITARKNIEVTLQKSHEALELMVEQRTKELRVANSELKSEILRRQGLEGEILAVSDREQQRLGQELHDGLCQHLTAVAFMARSMALRLRTHRVIDAADIEKIAQLVNDAAVDTRNLSRALHRVDVDAAGLIIALQDLVDREIWRTPCRLEVKPSFHINNDAVAAHLFRIAREAVINANKHAHARQIIVRLERSRREVVLRVIDDGIGFPKEFKPQQGLGYHIMNYRAQLAGGRLEIDSPQTGGTRVSCYSPLHAPKVNTAPYGDRPFGATAENSAVPVVDDLSS